MGCQPALLSESYENTWSSPSCGSGIPGILPNSALGMRPADSPVASGMFTFLLPSGKSAVPFAEIDSIALTSAPVSRPFSLVLSADDIRPSAEVVATSFVAYVWVISLPSASFLAFSAMRAKNSLSPNLVHNLCLVLDIRETYGSRCFP